MSLKECLKAIDKIKDDQQFMIEEHDAIYEYCKEQNFILNEEDMKTIISRGLEDCFESWKALENTEVSG